MWQTMKKNRHLKERNYQYANQLFDDSICHNANISKGSRQIDCIADIKMKRHELNKIITNN